MDSVSTKRTTSGRLGLSASISVGLNALALALALNHWTPGFLRIVALMFFLPGLRVSAMMGANPIGGPGWIWVLINSLLMTGLIFFLWALAPRRQASRPAVD